MSTCTRIAAVVDHDWRFSGTQQKGRLPPGSPTLSLQGLMQRFSVLKLCVMVSWNCEDGWESWEGWLRERWRDLEELGELLEL
jgi:hypothetical protein